MKQQEPPYIDKVYKGLKSAYGDKFTLTPEEFGTKMTDDAYVSNAYKGLKSAYGDEFNLTPDEFTSRFKKKRPDATSSNGLETPSEPDGKPISENGGKPTNIDPYKRYATKDEARGLFGISEDDEIDKRGGQWKVYNKKQDKWFTIKEGSRDTSHLDLPQGEPETDRFGISSKLPSDAPAIPIAGEKTKKATELFHDINNIEISEGYKDAVRVVEDLSKSAKSLNTLGKNIGKQPSWENTTDWVAWKAKVDAYESQRQAYEQKESESQDARSIIDNHDNFVAEYNDVLGKIPEAVEGQESAKTKSIAQNLAWGYAKTAGYDLPAALMANIAVRGRAYKGIMETFRGISTSINLNKAFGNEENSGTYSLTSRGTGIEGETINLKDVDISGIDGKEAISLYENLKKQHSDYEDVSKILADIREEERRRLNILTPGERKKGIIKAGVTGRREPYSHVSDDDLMNLKAEKTLVARRIEMGLDKMNNDFTELMKPVIEATSPFYAKVIDKAAQTVLEGEARFGQYLTDETKDVKGLISALTYGAAQFGLSAPYSQIGMSIPVKGSIDIETGSIAQDLYDRLKKQTGMSTEELMNAGVDSEGAERAIEGGIKAGLLEYAGEVLTLGAGWIRLGKGGKALAKSIGTKEISKKEALTLMQSLGRYASAAAIGLTSEALTEGMQTQIELESVLRGIRKDDGTRYTEEEISDMIGWPELKEAVFAGGTAGMGMGAMSSSVSQIIDNKLATPETAVDLISKEQENIEVENIESIDAGAERIQAQIDKEDKKPAPPTGATPEAKVDIPTESTQQKTDSALAEDTLVGKSDGVIYKSQNGKATITRNDEGKVVVLKSDGTEYTGRQILEYINESLLNTNPEEYEQTQFPEGLREDEYNDFIIENSSNPIEIAQAYIAEFDKQEVSKEDALAESGVSITEEGWNQEGDRNKTTNLIRNEFFDEEKGRFPSDIAQEINESNPEWESKLTADDVVNYILDFQKDKKGISEKRKSLNSLSDKFQELTGRTLDAKLAKRLTMADEKVSIEEQQKLDEINTALNEAQGSTVETLQKLENDYDKLLSDERKAKEEAKSKRDAVKTPVQDRGIEDQTENLKVKEQKIKDELTKLLGDFGKTSGAMTGIDPKQVEIAGRIIVKAAELGINKFEQLVKYIKENMHGWIDDNLDALKEAYKQANVLKVKKKAGRKKKSDLKVSLEDAITHKDGSYSAFIEKQIAKNEDNPDFQRKLSEVEPKNRHKVTLADIESTKIINKLIEEYGIEKGLEKAVWLLDNDHIPELMIPRFTNKIALLYLSMGLEEKALNVLDDTSKELTDAARMVKGADIDDSVEGRVTDIVVENINKRNEFLDQKFDEEKSLAVAIEELHKELAEIKQQRDELLEAAKNKPRAKSKPAPRIKETVEEKAVRLEKKAARLKKEGEDLLSKGLRKQRGTLSSGFAPNTEIIQGLTKILHSYIIKAQGNALLAFDQFKKDIVAEYEDITGTDLESIKEKLIEANKEAIDLYTKERQIEVINKVLKPKAQETKEERVAREDAIAEIVEGLEEGMEESELAGIIAKANGLKMISMDDIAKINRLANKHAELLVEGKDELAAIARENLLITMLDMGLISRHWLETALGWMYPAILSGGRTQEKSILGSSMTMTAGMVTEVLSNYKITGFLLERAWAGVEGFFGNYAYVIKTGRTQIAIGDRKLATTLESSIPSQPDVLMRTAFKKLGFRGKIGKGFAFTFMPIFRNIIAWDQVLTNSSSELKIALKEYNASDRNLTIAKRIEAAKKALALGEVETLKEQVQKEVRDNKARRNVDLSKIKQLKIDKPDGWQKQVEDIENYIPDAFDIGYENRRFRELINHLRRQEFVRESFEESKTDAYVGVPTGGWGAVYNATNNFIELLTKKGQHIALQIGGAAIKGLTLFLRIGFNVMQMGLNWTPMGAIKASRGFLGENYNKIWTKKGMIEMTPAYRKRVALQSAIGTSIGVSIFANMFDWDEDEGWKLKDEKDMYVVVYGNGTGNWFESETTRDDWKPWSIKFRTSLDDKFSNLYSYAYNPLGLALAPFGMMHDEEYFKDFQVKAKALKGDKEANIKYPYKGQYYLLHSGIRGISMFMVEQSFNKPIRTISKLFGARDAEEFSIHAVSLFTDPAKAFVPNDLKQFYDEYKSIMEQPEKTNNDLIDGLAKGIPFMDNLLNLEQYDILGYKVIKEFDVPFIPDSIIKWMFDNVDYREGKKDWELLWKYDNVTLPSVRPRTSSKFAGKTIEWTDTEKNYYVMRSGQVLSSIILDGKQYKRLNKLSAIDLQVELSLMHTYAKKQAKYDTDELIEARIKRDKDKK